MGLPLTEVYSRCNSWWMNSLRLILPADLRKLGYDPTSLAKRCRKGELVRVRHGAYADAEEWQKLVPRQKYGMKVAAFQEVVAKPPVFCHATSALLWGLWIVGTPSKLHVVTEVVSSGRSTKDVARHTGQLTENIMRCGPYLVASKLVTVMALIGELAFPYAVAVCDSALKDPDPRQQVNIFTRVDSLPGPETPVWVTDGPQGPAIPREELLEAAARLPSKAARDRVIAVIKFASALSGSPGESISRAKMYQLGFPAPVLQKGYILRDGTGASVDFWFKEQNLAGEFDGKTKYLRSDWSGGPMQDRLWKEKQREDDIRGQGVGFVRWTWRELDNSELFAALLRRAGLPQDRGRS